MWHPMHLHVHTFPATRPGSSPGARRDTVIVKPRKRVTVDVEADNPGSWMLHRHNADHAEAGMMTRLDYAL